MALTTRLLSFLVLGAIATAVGACANPAVQECGATGIFCPSGTHCAAAQGICLPDTNTCGDGHLDPGEICDDGNTIDDDNCSADCKSDNTCGNGIIDRAKGEVCDDSNTKDGDGCSHDCKSLETCGNGIKDIAEACDDGNNNDNDGCSHDCKSTEVCGNGIVDREVGEVCDPPTAGTCAPDCRSLLSCGNKVIDPGEECDDGLADNGDDKDCRSDCVINRCGDGRANTNGKLHKEDCDVGPKTADHFRDAVPTESATCNIDCTAPTCGDGKVNHSFKPNGVDGEQCDDGPGGANADNRDCTSACQRNVCGDGHQDTMGSHLEGCDDGNRIDTDACTNQCVAHSCGDSIVDSDAGEQCDLGSNNSDTGRCLANCRLAKCGDGHVEAGVEECDNGTNIIGSGCSPTCRVETCGNGIIDPGEECDNGAANNDNGDCRKDCVLNRCGDGHVNTLGLHKEDCDGATPVASGSHAVTPTETSTCNINCTTPACGDGILNRHFTPTKLVGGGLAPNPEQCDDGGRSPDNNCSPDCQFERCGNGIVDPGEECDGSAGPQPCSATCFQQRCGNGVVDPGEECDNSGANSDNADCRSDCVINRCGDGFVNTSTSAHHEACDGGPRPTTPGDRTAVPTDTADCNSNCTAPSCGDDIVNRLFKVPPGTLTEQCDPPGPGCSATCRLENCGNGVQDPGEQCDDGDGINGNACENDCTLPRCGNGFKDVGEECDDGNSSNADDCTNDCKFARCGDGFLRTALTSPTPPTIVEQCDTAIGPTACAYDSVLQPCSVCVACVLTPKIAPFCGDGHTDDPFESCDDGNTTCGSCSADCQTATLQASTGLIFAAAANDYLANGDTFSLSDGFTTKTFEITKGTATGTNILISVSAGELNAAVAGKIAAKISATLQITATAVGSVVTLTDLVQTVRGDAPIVSTVATTNFAVVGMGGSQGGNCASGQPCTQNVDCASHVCTITAGLVGTCAP